MKRGIKFYFLGNERWGFSFQSTDGFSLFYHKFRGQSIFHFFVSFGAANT